MISRSLAIALFLWIQIITSIALAEMSYKDVLSSYRLDGTANAFREGETIELGIQTPYLFKALKSSRHHWSLFANVGALSVANVLPVGQTEIEQEVFNTEVTLGLFSHGQFYDDFIYQYGKIAADLISFDNRINQGSALGVMFESGLEFRSNFAQWLWDTIEHPITIHLGLRWRFAFEPLDRIVPKTDLIEGVSFTIGTRVSL